MIWTDNIYNIIDDIIPEVRKNLRNPQSGNYVIRTAYKNMTFQECQEVVKYFQEKGFESIWYSKENEQPIIVISWGLPYDIDNIDNISKYEIENAGSKWHQIVKLLAAYINYVYFCSFKSVCVIPIEHLKYILGIENFSYKIFMAASNELKQYYSLKFHFGSLDDDGLKNDYIFIQRIENSMCKIKN